MQKNIVLTGITPSGTPHLGNYVGAIKPAIDFAKNKDLICYYFIADYHSLIKVWDAELRKQYTREIATTWLSLGLDQNLDNILFYKQSDIPQIMELNWILSTMASKGILNRAHAYKSLVNKNIKNNESDRDKSITMGLFNYPILMAADILLFDAKHIPVGKDQVQHIEIARDIASRLNHVYKKNILTLPEAKIDKMSATILGLDGRKMSKSYKNTIPIYSTEKKLRKSIMKIITNSQLPDEKKDPNNSTVFTIYQNFASDVEINTLKEKYLAGGMGWGDAKQILYEKINNELIGFREKYEHYQANPQLIDDIMNEHGVKARHIASQNISKIRNLIGI